MPGIIRVSVLEAVDLPEGLTDGKMRKDVTAKVTMGPRLFKTQPGVPDRGRIGSWNADFSFPVINLRDKLVISICDSEDHPVTQTAIQIPSIIQKGCRDEFVSLNKGGRIHLKMNFVLTDEERKKIETMRVAASKRREEAERLKNTVVFQPILDSSEKELKESPVSTVVIAEVGLSTTFDRKDSKEPPNMSLGFDSSPKFPAAKPESAQASTPRPKPAPKLMFNYAKAIGMQSGSKTTERRSNLVVPDNSSNGDLNSGGGTIKEGAEDIGSEVNSSSVTPPGSRDVRASPLVSKSVDSIPQSIPIPPGGSDSLTNNGDVNSKVLTEKKCAEEAGEVCSSETAKIDASLVLPTSTDGAASFLEKPTDSTPLTENLINAVKANNDDRNSEGQTVSESAGNTSSEVGSTGTSKLDPSIVDASPSIGHEAASMGNSASKATLPLSGVSSSGLTSLKIVKARLKRSFSKALPTQSSRRTSSRSVAARTKPLVPVVWLQGCVRKALSKVKGCFDAPA